MEQIHVSANVQTKENLAVSTIPSLYELAKMDPDVREMVKIISKYDLRLFAIESVRKQLLKGIKKG